MGGNTTRPAAKHDHVETAERGAQHVRLQRVLAAAGIGARRACEELIERGHVQVNGKTVNRLPAFVDPENDRITVDGRPVARATKVIWLMLNKPARVLATTDDDAGRTTIMDLVDHPARPRLFPVGRLDFETTGLVLLTNDGETANRLTHPRYGVARTYRADIKGMLDAEGLASLQRELIKQQRKDDKRMQRQSGRVRPTPAGSSRLELSLAGRENGRTVIHITLREGRTGNIASMLAGAGANVRKLERIAIGPVLLTGVASGRWRELERHEVRALRAAAAGKRFDPPEARPAKAQAARQAVKLPSTPAKTPAQREPEAPVAPSRRKPRTLS